MSVVLERWQAGMIAGSVLVAGLAVAGGAFLGGYALGDTRAPVEVTQPAPTQRIYTEDELRRALDTCGRDDVEIADGVAVAEPLDRQTLGTCVLLWLEAPGPAFTEYAYSETAFGSAGSVEWANVTFEWEQITGGRQTTITIN